MRAVLSAWALMMTKTSGERRWSDHAKRAISREAVEGSDPVAQVAKRNGLKKRRLYYWLKDPRFNPTLKGNTATTPEGRCCNIPALERIASGVFISQ
ncbi:transposase, partial [Pseudovibrio axinellae]